LSAVAAAVYLVGAVALRRGARRTAIAVCAFELTGVIVVGAFSRLDQAAFPDASVWSDFGGGYGHVPVLLPLAGLWFLLLRREDLQPGDADVAELVGADAEPGGRAGELRQDAAPDPALVGLLPRP
jgi:hypothetical protein